MEIVPPVVITTTFFNDVLLALVLSAED